MGATRLASEKMQLLFSRVRFTLLSLSLSVPTRDASPPLEVAFCAWGSADGCANMQIRKRADMLGQKKPLSVVTLKEAVKIKLAATYSPAGVQYHRRGWA